MKQILQELGTGRTMLVEVPAPVATRGRVCIATRRSLISAGTERMLVEFGRAGWLQKVRQQPDKARQVLQKVGTDGLQATVEAVRSRLTQAAPLGYSNAGVVLEVGPGVEGLRAGDRVVSNGPHAEVVAVSRNLCARIPEEVSDEAAAFTVLAAIALQGVRLSTPALGESFAVLGLGMIGLITVQLLRANGCSVLGVDSDPARMALARRFGAVTADFTAEDPREVAERFTRGRGVDGALIAAATTSSDPVSQAAQMCRKRGRVVLVGVAGLQLNRADFYEKELTFQVSCSYGPGRYDPLYEEQGQDYPLGFVRWTAQRNFEAVLALLAGGALDVEPLVSHRFRLEEAPQAYDVLTSAKPHLGILLQYPESLHSLAPQRTITLPSSPRQSGATAVSPALAVVGAGNYAARVLLPALARAGAQFIGVASRRGLTAAHVARKFRVGEATTDTSALIADPRVNAVVIATRHDSHADLTREALLAGKHVFVEKPLAISMSEIDALESTWHSIPAERRPLVMVGFNRRFAPHIARMKALLGTTSAPKTLLLTVNAGAIPAGHWTQDPRVGGGRLIGEGCHFIDLMRFLVDAEIESWQVTTTGRQPGGKIQPDQASVTLSFADGSMGSLHYLASGHASFPKERIEVFCAGRILQLDNFRRLRAYGWKDFRSMNRWRQDKGHRACAAAFIAAIREGHTAPIPFEQLIEVSRVTVAVGEAARS
jgi:predicted dehydrogenase/threonine dehydrogenase-like Zn-dependent dehydrogenase